LGKSIWKNALQEKRTKEWIEQWFEKEKSVEVKVKLFRLLKMSGQISTLVSGTLHLNPRINRAACAQLVTLDSALVCPFLNETWFRACSDEFVKAWIETNFKLVTSGEALNKLKKGNFSVQEKVIIASIMNGYNDANAIAFVLNQLKVTTVTLERMQWIRCLSKQSLVIDSLLLKMENLSPAEQYTLADIALQSRGYFKSPQSLTPQDSVLLFSEDYGVVALLADYVRSESEQFKGQEWLISRLKLQLNRLNGAETIETQIALVNALNAIDSATRLTLPVAAMQEFPCYKEWRRNKKSRLKIETEDGVFVFRLDGKSCPMSVSNIKLLAKENYYNGIEFHRVVPEFVVQAGCKRGDGMSGVNYVINSEFTSREFIPYSIGMASAGRNTEGAQFFITTNYTPHLNGRYTQFGELVHGKKKIKNIEIGTRILKVR
jgi:cyclophilin family peptidyl-prolyl cis-trans isomerase